MIEIIDNKKQSNGLKTVLKGLDVSEVLEWAIFKKNRAFKLYLLKKYDKSFQILSEVLTGIEDIDENEDEEVENKKKYFHNLYKIFKRIIDEIKIPCYLKIVSCLIEKGKYADGMKICEHVLSFYKYYFEIK